jgi:hypothetical protein
MVMVALSQITTMEDLIRYYDNHDVSEEDIAIKATEIIAGYNSDFAQIAKYRNLMLEAMERIDRILPEIDEAIEALDDAEESEEWDMMTDNMFLEWESDDAMENAEYEVDDVNRHLFALKSFLHQIGESASHLQGSDFDHNFLDRMNEDMWGDFFGGADNLRKIVRGRSQMIDLDQQLSEMSDKFSSEAALAEEKMQEIMNKEWEKAS